MITVKEIFTKKEMKAFVMFAFKLYKNNPYWVPPIINEELTTFDQTKNPVFKTAEAKFYLAYKNDTIVGRIVAIINWEEVNILQKKKTRFGWFEAIDDIDVTKALLEKVKDFGKSNDMDHMEGPIGFSNLDKVGVLTDGFDQLGNMITWYSMPYYIKHFEKLGLQKEKEYVESNFSFKDIKPEQFTKFSGIVKERYQLKCLNFKKTKELMPYVDKMFDLFNESYAKLQSFVPINDIQKEYFKKKYISFINPEFIKFVIDKEEKMVAFAIVMPGFATALQKAKGKLFPFGFYHLLQAKKHSKEVVFYLIGVHPEYQSKGVTAIIFDEYYKVCNAKGIEVCIRTPELVENQSIHNLWKNFNSKITKRRCTYVSQL